MIMMSATFNEEKQKKIIDELHLKEAEELAQVLAKKYQLPYIDLSKISINTDALRIVPEAEAREAKMAPFRFVGNNLQIAVLSPNNNKLKNILEDLKGKNCKFTLYLVSTTSLERAFERYTEISASRKTEAGLIEISEDIISDFLDKFKNLVQIRDGIKVEAEEAGKQGGISGILEIILSGALAINASDIHFEPQDEEVRLRYRLDGVLQDVVPFSHRLYKQLLSRVKLMSGLKLNIKQSAQDGRFSIKAGDLEIEIRTSVIPGAYGESIVLRVLNPKSIALSFEQLGVSDELFRIFDREIHKPNGLILLTGPTGSGKTTTLYAFLKRVNSPENKIITIEDPIEYHLKGISQTQVSKEKGYTFLSGLRSALRQDPDIIMVGEIRDTETAKIAINSALTGHLVFSTLHTNNSAGAIPRLIDLEINPKVMSSSLTLSIAQRLARKLCPYCKQADDPSSFERNLIEQVIVSIKKKKPEMELPKLEKVYRPTGCDKCNQTGYHGRQGLFEAVIMDEAVSEVAIKNPSEREIKVASISQGILDMRQDGIVKVLEGITSIEEIGRVVDLNEEII